MKYNAWNDPIFLFFFAAFVVEMSWFAGAGLAVIKWCVRYDLAVIDQIVRLAAG